jgi:glucose/arabinose dehydrogenase
MIALLLTLLTLAQETPPAPKCGSARPSLDAIKTAEGLVISEDGTIYFSQPFGGAASNFLGRYRPPYKEVELNWVDVGPKAVGITLDPKRRVLYVGSRGRKKLLMVSLTDPPVVRELADAEEKINGVTLAEDASVYYTDQGGGHVYRVQRHGMKSQVTTTPVEDPNGIAFGPDGKLYVLTYAKAKVTQIVVADGKEVSRSLFAEITAGKNADGITFDAKGHMYVTAGALFRLSVDGKTVTPLGPAYGANADFGSGALGCSDLYTAGNGKGIARYNGDTAGADVVWKRPVKKAIVPPPSPPPAVPAKLAEKVMLELVTAETTEALGVVAAPGDRSGRLFIVEKQGPIRILRGKTFAPKPFLDLTGKVSLWSVPNSEQGLLGLAFHPKYAKNGLFYINFTDPKGDTRVVEYRVQKSDPDSADLENAREILYVKQPYGNHNGGHLEFGPDGKLYVALGDGGSADDPHGNGQNPNTVLGKLLRIDVDAKDLTPKIIGMGLRNPWRYSFDRKTGDLYIADVGQNVWEQVQFVPAKTVGGPNNWGWNITEGKHCFRSETCERQGLITPVIDYAHSEGCSITGGSVYRGKAIPSLRGHYFFSDYCTAILRSFRMDRGKPVDSWDWKAALDPESQLAKISAFGQDNNGELYVITHEGPIFKFVPRKK